jgi:parallel beta-helix repeat protein
MVVKSGTNGHNNGRSKSTRKGARILIDRPLLLMVGTLLLLLALILISQSALAARTEHSPIRIEGDTEFTSANGVVSGTGTATDPYIIEEWSINCSAEPGILLWNTTKDLIVRNITIHGSESGSKYGLWIDNVSGNVRFERVNMTGTSYKSMSVEDVQGMEFIDVSSPSGTYIQIRYASNMTINNLTTGRINLIDSQDCTIKDCTVKSTLWAGIQLTRSPRTALLGCNISGQAEGIMLYDPDTNNCTIEGCVVTDNAEASLDFYYGCGEDHTLRNNTFGTMGVVGEGRNDVDSSNTVDGRPILYLVAKGGAYSVPNVGQIILYKCKDLAISNASIDGPNRGVFLRDCVNVTLHNVTVSADRVAVLAYGGTDITISSCDLTVTNTRRGYVSLNIGGVRNITVMEGSIHGGRSASIYYSNWQDLEGSLRIQNTSVNNSRAHGIYVYHADMIDMVIDDCHIHNNSEHGMLIESSASVTIRGTKFSDNGYTDDLEGVVTYSFGRVLVRGNEWIDCYNGIKAVLHSEAVISNNVFKGISFNAIDVAGENSTVHNNTLIGGPSPAMISTGISLRERNHTCFDNDLFDVRWGILVYADKVRVERNYIQGSYYYGAGISVNCYGDYLKDVVISNCTINASKVGITISYDSDGVIVTKSTITNIQKGILFVYPIKCVVTWNTISDCSDYAIDYQYGGGDNQFHHNNFIRCNYNAVAGTYNGPQAYDRWSSQFDDGSVGNFWSDYLIRYPNAKANGNIWDTPYDVAGTAGTRDRYPYTIMFDSMPPTADAGQNQTVNQGTTAILNATGSYDNIGIVSFEWDLVYDGLLRKLVGSLAMFRFDIPGTYQVNLTVEDAWGYQSRDSTWITVIDTEPPHPDAGPDITVDMNEEFWLSANGSWDNVRILSYDWIVRGEGLFLTPNGRVVNLTLEIPGNYTAELTCRDLEGNKGSDTMTITVLDNVPPVADAGPDVEVDQGTLVVLDGSESYDNVGISKWDWYVDYKGSNVHLRGVSVSFSFDAAGVHTVTLYVTDEYGLISTDKMTVTVRDIEPPIAVASEDVEVGQGDKFTMDGRWSSDNVRIVNFTWSFEDSGSPVTLVGEKVTYSFPEVGTYTITLTVIDPSGNDATDLLNVTVIDTTPPRADAGEDITTDIGAEVTFDGGDCSDNVAIVSYTWTFRDVDDQGKQVDVRLTGVRASYAFNEPGMHEVMLSIEDGVDLTAHDTLVVTVIDNIPPVAEAGDDKVVFIGATVNIDGQASTDNVAVVSHTWSFEYGGEALSLVGPTKRFTFEELGTYVVTLQVLDEAGNEGTDTVTVTVNPINIAWSIGPFKDKRDEPIEGVNVSVLVNGTLYEGDTDGDGLVGWQIPWYHLRSSAGVSGTKAGWVDLDFELTLDEDGNPTDPIPQMERKPKSKDSPGLGMPLVLVSLVIVLIVLSQRERRV